MRLFVASSVVMPEYANVKNDFQECIEAKWVAEEQLHLTWVFLGEQPDAKPFMDMLSKISALKEKTALRSLGYFGRPPRVLYVKARSKQLFEKAKEFEKSGFNLDRFKPHVTLCRIKRVLDREVFKEKVKAYEKRELGLLLTDIALYQSVLTDRGAIHTKLFSVMDQ